MKGFKVIPPKQKYMTLSEIYQAYGSRGVVAYSCREASSVPEGGFVIAVQDKPGVVYGGLKEYIRQFSQRYPDKAPVYYMRIEEAEGGRHLTVIYDNGTGEKKAAQKIEVKKSEAELMIEGIPDEIIAKTLASALKMPD